MLLGWFNYCKAAQETYAILGIRDPCLDTVYADAPQVATWKPNKRCWAPRQQGDTIGRIAHVHPSAGEKFFLRCLLCHVRGPTSFQDLRTTGSEATGDLVVHDTFQAACEARGLLMNDNIWTMTMQEAKQVCRHVYSCMLFVSLDS